MMEADSDQKPLTPVEIIRWNFASLKEDLHPEEVIDHLWSSHVFSDTERRICKEQDGKRAQTEELLEIVMKKGEKAYKEFCAALDKTHEHLKEMLDNTAKRGGVTSLVFVSETEVQERVSVMEQEIADLQKELDDARQEVLHTKAEHEREVNKLKQQKEEQKTKLEKKIKQLNTKQKSVETKLEKTKSKEEGMSKKCLHLQQDLKETREKLEALTTINTDGKSSDRTTSLKPAVTTVEETACVLQTSPDCDTGQLLLLPCLHAACKPCIDQHNQKEIVCSCGRDINLEKEYTAVDFVRRNELAITADKHECEFLTEQCTEKVVSRCKTCNISMCSNCTNKHDTTRTTSQHAVVLAEKFNEMPIREQLPPSTCSNHPTKTVKFFDEQCNTSVCSVCAIGKHKEHGIKDLDDIFQETKMLLVNKVDQHKEHLEKIQISSRQAQSQMTELEERAHQMKKEIADVHTDLALHLVKRLKFHNQQIEKEVRKNSLNLQKDMECFGTEESAVLATLRYAERAMASTTCAQFMDLSSTIVSKIEEDLLRPFPEDSVKTKVLTFTPKGHKALREMVAMFGDVSTSDKDVPDADTVPTIAELQSQLAIFKDQEKKPAKEVGTSLKDHLESQGIYFLGAGQTDLSSILHCIHLKFDVDKVNLNYTHINTEGDLVNKKLDTRSAKEGRLKYYRGTCSTNPLPQAGCPQYWEIETRVGLDKSVNENAILLEVGLCAKEDRDLKLCIDRHPHAYSLAVSHCSTHEGICRKIRKEGKNALHLPGTMPNAAGASDTLHYGAVYDDARRKIVFIDVKENKVMSSTLDHVDSSQHLWPMFGVYNSTGSTVSMRLVVGRDINMTEEKKAMIVKALS